MDGATGSQGATGPQGPAGLSGYQTRTIATNVKLDNVNMLTSMQTIVVDCPSGTNSVLSGFIYRAPGGVRYPFPPGVDWASWASARAQMTFVVRNHNTAGYTDPIEAGVVCANSN